MDCVVREVKEELNIDVSVGRLLATWQFQPIPDRHVLFVAYVCSALKLSQYVTISHEHKAVGYYCLESLAHIRLPLPYTEAIRLSTSPQER